MVNHKRLFRLYREERLMVRRRGGRKRALGTRAPMLVTQWPNDRWSLDFVADQLIDGRRLRILVVVDDCTRECLALVPDTSISGTRVARELDRLMVAYGKPTTIVSDNGTELTSNAILRWTDDHKLEWHYIAPGKPVQNAFAESCPLYVSGLIGPGDRKSIQPMAERLALGEYDQLHHFIAAGVWDLAPVETELLVQADRLVGGSDAVLVIDDTAIAKKGAHSVGVAPQMLRRSARPPIARRWCR